MPDPDETRTVTGWQTSSRFYRRRPGLGWLLALLVIPLLLGFLGWGMLDESAGDFEDSTSSMDTSLSAPEVTAPESTLPGQPAALSITRSGNDITLLGDLPDAAAKAGLLEVLGSIHGPDVNLVDNLYIKAGAVGPNLSGLQAVLRAAVDVPDFSWTLDGNELTLGGTAPDEEVRAAIEATARSAWPEANIDNRIEVVGASAPDGECADLQADITALLHTPVNFEPDGTTLTAESEQMLAPVAEKITACPGVRVSVDGFTDSTGNDAINIPLSTNRAKAVADFLVSRGVAADLVTSQGHGSANPIADNDTAEGQAANRRVEITVS